jgi:hypothetical protein
VKLAQDTISVSTRKENTMTNPNQRSTYVPEEDKRAGHEDRDHYVECLKSAVATGHLTDDEFEERSSEALRAVTKKDLMVLVADVPELPKRNTGTKRVRYQVAEGSSGHAKFSPVRWGITLFIGLTMIILPGPLFSSIFHGLDHAPAQGGLPIMLVVFGAFITIIGGICFAPAESEEVPNR